VDRHSVRFDLGDGRAELGEKVRAPDQQLELERRVGQQAFEDGAKQAIFRADRGESGDDFGVWRRDFSAPVLDVKALL
jgi:hypothetical protein